MSLHEVIAFPSSDSFLDWYEVIDNSLAYCGILLGDVLECRLETTISPLNCVYIVEIAGHILATYLSFHGECVALYCPDPTRPIIFCSENEIYIHGPIVRIFREGVWYPASLIAHEDFWLRWAIQEAS